MKKLLLSLLTLLPLGLSLDAEEKAIEITPESFNLNSTSTGYITEQFEFSAGGFKFTANNVIPKTTQLRGSKEGAANFYIYNTDPITNIKSLSIETTGGTLNATNIDVANSDAIISEAPTSTSSNITANGTTWNFSESQDFFRFQFQKSATSGNVCLTKITIVYDDESGSEPADPVAYEPNFQDVTMEEGETRTLDLGTKYPKAMVFSLSNANVVTVSNDGILTAVAPGKVTVDVAWDPDENFTEGDATFTVTVTKKPAEACVIFNAQGNNPSTSGSIVTLPNGDLPGNTFGKDITFEIEKHNTTSTSNVTDNFVRWYKSDIIKINPVSGATITKIVINCGNSKFGDITIGNNTITASKESPIATFDNIYSNNVIEISNSAQIRFSSLEVYYAVDIATPVVTMEQKENGYFVTMSCGTEGAEIRYAAYGADPTVEYEVYREPILVWEPVEFNVIAVKDDKTSAMVTFRADVPYCLEGFSAFTDLADFMTDDQKKNGVKVIVDGQMTVLYQHENYLYVASNGYFGCDGYMCLYGATEDTYKNGDTFTHLEGTFVLYNGLPEIKDYKISNVTTTGKSIEAAPTSITKIGTNMLNYYVTLENVSISEVNDKNFIITQDESQSIPGYNTFGIVIENKKLVNVTGFVSIYDEAIQLLPTEIITSVPEKKVTWDLTYDEIGGLADGVTADNHKSSLTVTTDAGLIYKFDADWCDEVKEGHIGYITNKGAQFGSPSKNIKNMTITVSGLDGKLITGVTVATCGPDNGSDAFSMNVKVNGRTFKHGDEEVYTLKATDEKTGNKIDFKGLGSGDVCITYANPDSKKVAFYISSITISYKDVKVPDGALEAPVHQFVKDGDDRYVLFNIHKDLDLYYKFTPANSVSTLAVDHTGYTLQDREDDDSHKIKVTNGTLEVYTHHTLSDAKSDPLILTIDDTTGIDEIAADGAQAEGEYYNLQGVRVDNPTPGLYIKKQGNTATKVIVK